MKLMSQTAILKCNECDEEFFYEKKFLAGTLNPEDYIIECRNCENWESVSNNTPSNFTIVAQ